MSGTIVHEPPKVQTVQKQINVGEFFTLSREANPGSTGYVWELVSISDMRVLKLTDYHEEPVLLPPHHVNYLWTFEGIRPGTATVALAFNRPWEMQPPQDFTEVTVTGYKVEVGNTLTLYRRANPGIQGEIWEVVSISDPTVLVKTMEQFVPDVPGQVSVWGYDEFTFKALKAGRVDIVLRHLINDEIQRVPVTVI